MTRTILPTCLALLILLGGCRTKHTEPMTLAPDDPALADLAWLTGSWASDIAGTRSEEHWTQPSAGTMFGVNRTMRQGRTVFFEFLRIEARDDGVFFLASPLGRDPATPFQLVTVSDHRVIFENPDHDFPQRITYWLEGETLHATTEGEMRGTKRTEVFQWQRARLAP